MTDTNIVNPNTDCKGDQSERDPEGVQVGNNVVPMPQRNRATAQPPKKTAEERREEAWALCNSLATSPDILSLISPTLASHGVVGEDRALKVIYLALTSRLDSKPVSIATKAQSATGKNSTVDAALKLCPPSAYYKLSSLSEKALAYIKEPLKHRTLVVAEAPGLASSGLGAMMMRTLLSEGFIRHQTVQDLEPKVLEVEGPTNLIVTTTAFQLEGELETRLLSVPLDDSDEQTRAILRAQAVRAMSGAPRPADLQPWIALQTWLELSEHRVVIRFAAELAEAIPTVAVRLRRDFPALLSLIKAHAILHQANRGRDPEGQIIALDADYYAVRDLIRDLVGQAAGVSVPAEVRETVEAVRTLSKSYFMGVPQKPLVDALGIHKSNVSRRVEKAIGMGYLRKNEPRPGHAAAIVLGKPLPDEVEVYPDLVAPRLQERLRGQEGPSGGNPEELRGCAVAEVDKEAGPEDSLELPNFLDRRGRADGQCGIDVGI